MPKGKEIKKKKQGCGSLQTEHDPRSELVRVTVTLVIVTVVGAATDAYTAGTTSQACWHFTNTLNFTRANEAAAITIPRGWVANLGLSTMLPLLRDNVNTVLTFVRAQRFGIKIPSGGHKLKASRMVSKCFRRLWPKCLVFPSVLVFRYLHTVNGLLLPRPLSGAAQKDEQLRVPTYQAAINPLKK